MYACTPCTPCALPKYAIVPTSVLVTVTCAHQAGLASGHDYMTGPSPKYKHPTRPGGTERKILPTLRAWVKVRPLDVSALAGQFCAMVNVDLRHLLDPGLDGFLRQPVHVAGGVIMPYEEALAALAAGALPAWGPQDPPFEAAAFKYEEGCDACGMLEEVWIPPSLQDERWAKLLRGTYPTLMMDTLAEHSRRYREDAGVGAGGSYDALRDIFFSAKLQDVIPTRLRFMYIDATEHPDLTAKADMKVMVITGDIPQVRPAH